MRGGRSSADLSCPVNLGYFVAVLQVSEPRKKGREPARVVRRSVHHPHCNSVPFQALGRDDRTYQVSLSERRVFVRQDCKMFSHFLKGLANSIMVEFKDVRRHHCIKKTDSQDQLAHDM